LNLDWKSVGLEKVLRVILALLIVCNFLSLLVIFISHLSFPFPLEWAEEGVLHHCIQIMQGNQIYAEPSAAFVAFPYTPLYYYLGALLMKLLGEGFLALRIISMLSFLGSLVLVYRIISNETRNRLAPWIGCGLFAASFGVVGNWYDVGRVDSLAIFLILFSGYVLRCYPAPGEQFCPQSFFPPAFSPNRAP